MGDLFGKREKGVLLDPLYINHPIAVQVLGICSSLAVTTKMETALIMSVGLTVVTAFSNLCISIIRNVIPNSIRMIVEMAVVSSLVIVVDQAMKAYAYTTSKQLSVFVGLIITNCIVMGRLEAFAIKEKPWISFLDGIGQGLGYTFLLVFLAFIREIFGSGKIMGFTLMRPVTEGGWYNPNGLLLIAPGALLLCALFIWILRSWKTQLIEKE